MSALALRDATRQELERRIQEETVALVNDFGGDLASLRGRQMRILGYTEALKVVQDKMRELNG